MSATALDPTLPSRPRFSGVLEVAKRLRRNPRVRGAMLGAFRWLQQRGVCITPNHFYWPIPDVTGLSARRWPSESQVVGVDLHLERQREFLDGVIARFANECEFPDAPTELSSEYHYNNGLFEAVDAEIAYSMVRWLRPRCIVEIGSGYSTRVMASALVRNFERYANDCHFVSIEPNPDAVLSRGFTGLTRVVPKRVQDAELDIPSMLNAGDILFIDSSHVVAVGSDVVYEFLEVLPRLRSGVVVHVHDIFLPADYPRDTVLDGLCFWSEQYLLQAFLSFNRDYEVLWSSSAMQSAYPADLARVFPRWEGSYERMPEAKRQFIPTMDGKRIWPSSFWMRRK